MLSYEEASRTMESVAKQLIQTAILFDTLHENGEFLGWLDHGKLLNDDNYLRFTEIEEQSIQLIADLRLPSRINVDFHRNLKPLTQKLFGFQYAPSPQLHAEEDQQLQVHVCLMPTIESGPKISEFLIQSHYVFATFSMPVERETDSSEFWFGTSLAFDGVFTAQRRIHLGQQQSVSGQMVTLRDELDQLDVMCKTVGSYSPYAELLDKF